MQSIVSNTRAYQSYQWWIIQEEQDLVDYANGLVD